MNRALAFLLVLLTVSPAAVGAGMAQLETRNADLALETPPGTDGSVSRDRVNGTVRYTTPVAPVNLHPQNFESDQLVDYGVETPGGQLQYESQLGQYEFTANATGSYRVFWVVSEQIRVNESGNVTTERAQVRYEAVVRVTDSTNVSAITQSELEGTRADAEEWREFNSSVLSPLMDYGGLFATEPESRQELITKMSAAYKTVHSPFSQLGGNISSLIVLLMVTTGGLLLVAIVAVYHFGMLAGLRGQVNRFITGESHEGEIADRQANLQQQQDKIRLENTAVQDVDGVSDREAGAFRDGAGGVTMRDVNEEMNTTGPLSEIWVAVDRLHGAGAAGYGARVTPDGDAYDVDVVAPDDVPGETEPATSPGEIDGETWVDLEQMDSDMDELLLTNMDAWNDEPLRSFNLATADFDPADSPHEFESLDIESIRDGLGVDEHRFEDPESFGTAVKQLVEHTRQHPISDGAGRPDPTRETLERLLKLSGVFADRYNVPVYEFRRQSIERALSEFDPGAKLEQQVEAISNGQHAGAD